MKKQNTDIEEIMAKSISASTLSGEEQAILDAWIQDASNREKYYELQRIRSAVYAVGMSKKINSGQSWEQVHKRLIRHQRRKLLLSYAVAAAVLVVSLGISLRLLTEGGQEKIQTASISVKSAVIPGQKQAILTLSTGQRITLSDSLPPLTEKNGTTIQNTGQQLVYNPADTATLLVYNTVTVPRGGEYRLKLSDGSTVWINSESEITYPVNFSPDKREIRLRGEAFFEIQKDSTKPFLVRTDPFTIRVTGTEFNVRNYPQDIASATLARGRIQLEKKDQTTRLLPGQQASLIEDRIQVKEVDVEEAIAWRYEAFCFKQRPLESLLNEIARWYDIEIFYQAPETRNYHFTAWFRRSTPIQELIKILEKTKQIKLELKGKTLIVKTNHT